VASYLANAAGCILRIASEEWVDQVFSTATYYTGIRRKWQAGQTIVFVHKTGFGDAVVGYGIVEKVRKSDEFSEEERSECDKWRWKEAIEFKYVIRYEKPLRTKDSILGNFKIWGRTLHGFPLSKEQLEAIISQAEQLQTRKP
jgi:hypothetical protein